MKYINIENNIFNLDQITRPLDNCKIVNAEDKKALYGIKSEPKKNNINFSFLDAIDAVINKIIDIKIKTNFIKL